MVQDPFKVCGLITSNLGSYYNSPEETASLKTALGFRIITQYLVFFEQQLLLDLPGTQCVAQSLQCSNLHREALPYTILPMFMNSANVQCSHGNAHLCLALLV